MTTIHTRQLQQYTQDNYNNTQKTTNNKWKINNYYIFWVCVCSPRYPPYNAPYCHLWHALLYNIFLHYLVKGTIFEKRTFLNVKCMFRFSPQLLSKNVFHSKKKWAIYDQKCVLVFRWSTLYSCPIFSTDFRKMLIYQISWKPFQWEPSFPCGQDGRSDRHDEANSRFSQLCERP